MASNIAEKSAKNREYVRRMLGQKQPAFAAALELAVELVGRELTQDAALCPRRARHRPSCGGFRSPRRGT